MDRIEILDEMKKHEVLKKKFHNIMNALQESDIKIKLEIRVVTNEGDMFIPTESTDEKVSATESIFMQYVNDEIETREREIQKLIERLK